MKSLKGKKCLITGATGGIGREIAEVMVKEGCKVSLTALPEGLVELAKKLSKKYKTKVQALYDTHSGEYDILINSAGVFEKCSIEEANIHDMMFVNFMLPTQLIKQCVPAMKRKKWGRIVNIGSSSAYNGFAMSSIYCATKHAILGLSRALHNELKRHGIRVFCVSPAGVKTPMGKRAAKNDNYSTFLCPKEVAEYILHIIKYDKNMVTEEIRLNRIDDR